MTTDPISNFQSEYLTTWTEPDPGTRRSAIERVWRPDGRMVVSSAGITLPGVDAIAAHVDQVHNDLIAGKGLTFAYDQHIQAEEALLLRWSMLTPAGETVGRGVDVVFRDSAGQVETVYMFMGVN